MNTIRIIMVPTVQEGREGAAGLLAMASAGGATFPQNESTSKVSVRLSFWAQRGAESDAPACFL
jgi:hypothetical protein